jgi:hypothetical protein
MSSKVPAIIAIGLAVVAMVVMLAHYKSPVHSVPVCPVCEKCQDFSSILKDIETLTKQLGQGPQPKVDEMGLNTVQVGQYEKATDAATDKVALQKYIKDCAGIPSSWFCFDTLADRIEIQKGTYSYFLVINRLTSPEVFALCNFMWSSTTMDRWARHNNHGCREFDKHYMEP